MNEVLLQALTFVAQTGATTNVVPLLTGGGFVFLAAIAGGLFMLSKNRADGAKSIAEGSAVLVKQMQEQNKAISAKLGDVTESTSALIEALDVIMSGVRPPAGEGSVSITVTAGEWDAVRAALRTARRHLY